MKKIIVVCTLLIFSFFFSNAYAHSPSSIRITFDRNTKMLTAVVEHNTEDVSAHYIKTVEVVLNGKKILSHTISKQDNNSNQTVIYRIPDVKINDTFTVQAYCSLGGTLKRFYTIRSTSGGKSASDI